MSSHNHSGYWEEEGLVGKQAQGGRREEGRLRPDRGRPN